MNINKYGCCSLHNVRNYKAQNSCLSPKYLYLLQGPHQKTGQGKISGRKTKKEGKIRTNSESDLLTGAEGYVGEDGSARRKRSGRSPRYSAKNTRRMRFHARIVGRSSAVASSCVQHRKPCQRRTKKNTQ